ncbi:zinc ribbon-containing protein [Gynuella sp.]|uniref:zinc ribbon-containing protein n=1 Tax=Gynuella sp. TaxID=2969146 RepID=UPI003D0ED17A
MSEKTTKTQWTENEVSLAEISPVLDFTLADALMSDVMRTGEAQKELDWMDQMYRLRDQFGLFHAGELAPAAILYCEICGEPHPVFVAQKLAPCSNCGHSVFLYQDNQKH